MDRQKVDLTEKFRREGGHLYELCGNAYVHVYQNARLARAPIGELIAAYRECVDPYGLEDL